MNGVSPISLILIIQIIGESRYQILFDSNVLFSSLFLLTTILVPTKQREVELGNGLPDIRSMGECIEALKHAGFEVSCVSCIL